MSNMSKKSDPQDLLNGPRTNLSIDHSSVSQLTGHGVRWDSVPLKFLMEYVNLDVSKNRGIPKSSILIRFGTIINHPFWGYTYFWKQPYYSDFIRRVWSPQFVVMGSGNPPKMPSIQFFLVSGQIIATENKSFHHKNGGLMGPHISGKSSLVKYLFGQIVW